MESDYHLMIVTADGESEERRKEGEEKKRVERNDEEGNREFQRMLGGGIGIWLEKVEEECGRLKRKLKEVVE